MSDVAAGVIIADGVTGHGWFHGRKLANGAQRAASAAIDYGPCFFGIWLLGPWGCVPVIGWLSWNSVWMQSRTTQSLGKMIMRTRLVVPSSDPLTCATYWAVPPLRMLASRTASVFFLCILPIVSPMWFSIWVLWPILLVCLCADDRRESLMDKFSNTMVLARAEDLRLSTTQGARDR